LQPHQDGPLYFPVVAIVSLGSPTVMRFVPHQSNLEPEEGTPPSCAGQLGETKEDSQDAADGAPDHGLQEEYESGLQEHQKKAVQLPTEKCLPHNRRNDISVILMPGSLLIFKDSAYQGG
jgi:alkylated DNA repair protein alkB family protein 6